MYLHAYILHTDTSYTTVTGKQTPTGERIWRTAQSARESVIQNQRGHNSKSRVRTVVGKRADIQEWLLAPNVCEEIELLVCFDDADEAEVKRLREVVYVVTSLLLEYVKYTTRMVYPAARDCRTWLVNDVRSLEHSCVVTQRSNTVGNESKLAAKHGSRSSTSR